MPIFDGLCVCGAKIMHFFESSNEWGKFFSGRMTQISRSDRNIHKITLGNGEYILLSASLLFHFAVPWGNCMVRQWMEPCWRMMVRASMLMILRVGKAVANASAAALSFSGWL